MTSPRKTGRPSKGPRRLLAARIPVSLIEAMEVEVKALGEGDFTAIIAQALADRYDMPNPMPNTMPKKFPLNHAA